MQKFAVKWTAEDAYLPVSLGIQHILAQYEGILLILITYAIPQEVFPSYIITQLSSDIPRLLP